MALELDRIKLLLCQAGPLIDTDLTPQQIGIGSLHPMAGRKHPIANLDVRLALSSLPQPGNPGQMTLEAECLASELAAVRPIEPANRYGVVFMKKPGESICIHRTIILLVCHLISLEAGLPYQIGLKVCRA